MSFEHLSFEVFGKVQKVYFRVHTQQRATELGLRGWVKNTEQGTVVGEAVGSPEAIAQMRHWLENVGSPASRIERAVFTSRAVDERAFQSQSAFDVVRKPKSKS